MKLTHHQLPQPPILLTILIPHQLRELQFFVLAGADGLSGFPLDLADVSLSARRCWSGIIGWFSYLFDRILHDVPDDFDDF